MSISKYEQCGDYYKPEKGIGEIFAINRLSLHGTEYRGNWHNQTAHAQCNLDLLAHRYPLMDSVTKARATRTMKMLQEQYGL